MVDTNLAAIRFGRHGLTPEVGEARLEESLRLFADWNGTAEGRIEVRPGAHAADACSPVADMVQAMAPGAREATPLPLIGRSLTKQEEVTVRWPKQGSRDALSLVFPGTC